MTSNISLPSGQSSSDQGLLQIFSDNFYLLTQQTKSKFINSGAAFFLPSKGKVINFTRMGRTELVAVSGRNPDKQYVDFSTDNRQMVKSRYTRTFLIDEKDDINELITDPTSAIYETINYAKERTIDRVIAANAVGSVLIGRPDRQTTSLSAANDGVLTVTATSGLTYAKVQEITENFINNDVDYSMFQGSVLAISGAENTDLTSEDEFINNDYIKTDAVGKGVVDSAGTYKTIMFAGSKTGGITVTNPVLPEASSVRTCMVLAPQSVGVAMEVNSLRIEQAAGKVGSKEITIDFWIGAMRKEGVLVQKVNTTI